MKSCADCSQALCCLGFILIFLFLQSEIENDATGVALYQQGLYPKQASVPFTRRFLPRLERSMLTSSSSVAGCSLCCWRSVCIYGCAVLKAYYRVNCARALSLDAGPRGFRSRFDGPAIRPAAMHQAPLFRCWTLLAPLPSSRCTRRSIQTSRCVCNSVRGYHVVESMTVARSVVPSPCVASRLTATALMFAGCAQEPQQAFDPV